MPGSIENQSIKLEFISAKNLKVPSRRQPAGIYISINVDSSRRWKSAISVLPSKRSIAWGDTVTLSPQASPSLSVEIRASYEVERTLGNGEAIGTLETSWDELLDHGDEPFKLSFPPVRGVHPSLTLKAAVVDACDNQDLALFDSLVDCEIARDTDVGHARFAEYRTSKRVSHLNDAVRHFQLVLDRCSVDHPDHPAALTNLAWTCLRGYIQKDIQGIDTITFLFRKALSLRPQAHPDHTLSLYRLIFALNWRYDKERTAVHIQESAQLCSKLLPLCQEGTYLRSIGVDGAVDYVISACNKLPIKASNEGIRLQRVVLELCSLCHQRRPRSLHNLSWSLFTRFEHQGSIDDIDECIQLRRESVSLCPEGHWCHDDFMNDLALSLVCRFDNQRKFSDLNEAISLYEKVLRLSPVGHKARDVTLDNLGNALRTRFSELGDVDDIRRAINLHWDAVMLLPLEHPRHKTALMNIALAFQTRFVKSHNIVDLHVAIELHRQSLRIRLLDDPDRPVNLCNLSAALCSRFKQTGKDEDIEEAIRLCQESLEALPTLHTDRYCSYLHLQEAYMSRYWVRHNPADLSLAVENFKLGSRHPTQGLARRIIMSYNWTFIAEQDGGGSALEAYSTFFELLDAHLATKSSPASRREAAAAFHYARSLPVDAASCAIRCDDTRHAVELVEHGRGQQWSLASRLRTPLEDLESTNPNLARRFSELSKSLSADQGSTGSIDRAAADRAETKYRKLTEQWDDAVAQIRNLEGFARFLLPPSYTELQAAACHGPVIILIASKYSCSAIIVPTSGEPHHVRFPRITLPHLEKLKDDFATAIRHTARMRPEEPRKKLRVLLRTVWDEIMLFIVNVLQPAHSVI